MTATNKEVTSVAFVKNKVRQVRFNYNKTKQIIPAKSETKKKMSLQISLLPLAGNIALKTPEGMLHRIAHTLHVSPDCFCMRTRQRAVAELRFLGAYFLRIHFPELRLQQIAILFGGQDHSSIVNGISRANDLISSGDAVFTEKYEKVSRSIELWLQKDATNYGFAATA